MSTEEAIRHYKTRYQNLLTIFDKFPDFMSVCDLDTYEVLFVNGKLRNLIKTDVEGKRCYELFHGRSEPCEYCTNDIITKTNMPHVWDNYNEYLGRHFLNTDQTITWHDGRKVRLECAIDITDQKKIEALLHASETKYRSFVEQSCYGFYMANLRQEVTYLNGEARKIYGMGEDEPVSLKMSELFVPEDYDRVVEVMGKIAAGKETKRPAFYTIRCKNGANRIVEIQTFPIWKDDELAGFHGTVVDVTDRVNAEKQYREKSEFLDAVVNNTSDGIFVVDEDIRYVLINPASGRILGHDPKEWIGKQAGTNKHPDDHEKAVEAFMKVVNGEPSSCEIRVKAKDGNYHLLDIRYNPMMLNDKFHVLGMVTDITEKKKAETALRDSEEKYRNLFEHSPDSIILLDEIGQIMECNRATLKLFGMEHENIIGLSLDKICLIDALDRNFFKGALDSVINGSRVERIELELSTLQGQDLWVEIIPTLIKKRDEFYAVQMISKDITEAKSRELELRQRFLKFELREGGLYLAKEAKPTQATEAFNELLAIGYSGTVITRESKKDCDRGIKSIYRYVKISDTERSSPDKFTSKELLGVAANLPRGEAVLIDCLEYCRERNGSRKTLKMVQDMRDLAHERRLIIILSVNPSALPGKDLSMIEHEAKSILPSIFTQKLPGKLLAVLEYIDEENRIGKRPAYSDIGARFNISKPTVRTRVNRLMRDGAIKETTKGRQKVLEITESGKKCLGA